MNIGYIHTNHANDVSFFQQERTLLGLHCERILFDEGKTYDGLFKAIDVCNGDDHLFCLPLDQIVSSPDVRNTIQSLMRAKRIDVTTII